MVSVVVFEFSGMRCQPLRRALYASNQKVDSCDNLISESA
ncbi:acetyltransferase [Vibrio cholerae]